MAKINHSATVHPVSDSSPPHPPSFFDRHLTDLLIFFAITLVLALLYLVYVLFMTLPTVQLISGSATPLSLTIPATLNLSLQVSNPNLASTITSKKLHISVFYIDHKDSRSSYFEPPLITETDLRSLVWKRRSQKMLYLCLSISTETVSKQIVRTIMEDQRRGLLRFRIRVSFLLLTKGLRTYPLRALCRDLNIVFGSNTSIGFASDLPKKCPLILKKLHM